MPQPPRNRMLAMDCKMMESGVKVKLRELLAKDHEVWNSMLVRQYRAGAASLLAVDYEVEETGMLVKNYKEVKLARNKQHLVEAASRKQSTRNSMLAKDYEVVRNSMLVRNCKVQQSISLTRSSMLAKNCEVVWNNKLDCEVEETGMLVKNCKEVKLARNNQLLVEAVSQRQTTRNSMLAKDREVVKNSKLVRNCKVQQSISLTRNRLQLTKC